MIGLSASRVITVPFPKIIMWAPPQQNVEMHTYKSTYYYNTIRVPVFPAIPSLDFSNNVIIATRPF